MREITQEDTFKEIKSCQNQTIGIINSMFDSLAGLVQNDFSRMLDDNMLTVGELKEYVPDTEGLYASAMDTLIGLVNDLEESLQDYKIETLNHITSALLKRRLKK